MNIEEKQKKIDELKKVFNDNEEFIKNGKKFHRFVIQKVDLPQSVGNPFLNIMYDENKNPAWPGISAQWLS